MASQEASNGLEMVSCELQMRSSRIEIRGGNLDIRGGNLDKAAYPNFHQFPQFRPNVLTGLGVQIGT